MKMMNSRNNICIFCIKDYTDEYGFKYYKGKSYKAAIEKDWEDNEVYSIYSPGKGPMGSLAISNLTRNNFIRLEEERENKLKQLLTND